MANYKDPDKRKPYRLEVIKWMLYSADKILLQDREWAARTKDVDPCDKGITTMTINRMRRGTIPNDNTLTYMRLALIKEAELRGFNILDDHPIFERPGSVIIDGGGTVELGSGDQALHSVSS